MRYLQFRKLGINKFISEFDTDQITELMGRGWKPIKDDEGKLVFKNISFNRNAVYTDDDDIRALLDELKNY